MAKLEELQGWLQKTQNDLAIATKQRDALAQFISDNPQMGQFNDTLALCRNQAEFAVQTNTRMVNTYVELIQQQSK
jgi:hypothetical protein